MRKVSAPGRKLTGYKPFVEKDLVEEIQQTARSLRGVRIVQVNATRNGGGVAEILRSLVPLLNDAGLDADWYVLSAEDDFFQVTKRMHNQLQGEPGELSDQERQIYLRTSEQIHRRMSKVEADLWLIHDPQPAAAGACIGGTSSRIWRSHIDTSAPNHATWELLLPFVSTYDAIVYSHESYRFPQNPIDTVHIIELAIDPLSAKNRTMSRSRARKRLARLGIDPERPLVSQVARLDKWKDPIGVIAAYRLARKRYPDLQLALVGVMAAQDDPEALEMYLAVKEAAGDDPEIHVYVDAAEIRQEDIAAFQAGSDVVIQKSLREGFGLSITEAMWQGTPVVAGDTVGSRLQVTDGEIGFIVKDIHECADRIVQVLQDDALAERLSGRARERVRAQYLLPRLLLQELRLYSQVLQSQGVTEGAKAKLPRALSPLQVAAASES
jgi:trehalose synthase